MGTTKTRGPVEAAIIAEEMRISGLTNLSERDKILAMLIANQHVIAKALDELGHKLVTSWDDILL
jgi:hypothetical protein